MTLADELAADHRPRGAVCGVARALAEADPALAAEAADVLRNPRFESSAISRVLARHGVRVSAYSVARHRRGDCSC